MEVVAGGSDGRDGRGRRRALMKPLAPTPRNREDQLLMKTLAPTPGGVDAAFLPNVTPGNVYS